MINRQTVLVLGAGASVPYGFPTGAELRKQILALEDDNTAHHPEQWANFHKTFQHSERGSIDSFLGQHKDLVDVGSFAIATVLLRHERNANFFNDDNRCHWYRYLFNALTEYVQFKELDFSKLQIITFNIRPQS